MTMYQQYRLLEALKCSLFWIQSLNILSLSHGWIKRELAPGHKLIKAPHPFNAGSSVVQSIFLFVLHLLLVVLSLFAVILYTRIVIFCISVIVLGLLEEILNLIVVILILFLINLHLFVMILDICSVLTKFYNFQTRSINCHFIQKLWLRPV